MAARFSIIVPSYNGGAYLRDCVASVRAQTRDDWELCVLDDGSSDGSLEWLQALDEPRLKLYPAAHLGIEQNWTRALAIPKAEFMTILGQDDVLDPNYLEVMAALIEAHPEAGLYHANFRLIDGAGRLLRRASPPPERETGAQFLAARLRGQRDSFATGYLMRSARYAAVGGIPRFAKLLYADDVLWLLLMAGSYKATARDECFAYRYHPQSTSGSADWRVYRAALGQMLGFLESYRRCDPAVERVLSAEIADFPLSYYRDIYEVALIQATKCNRRLDPAALPTLQVCLELHASSAPRLNATRKLRLLELLNANPLARRLCLAWLRIRGRD